MSKPDDFSISDPPDQSGRDVASLLMKMHRQLLFLEKKIDILIHQAEEKSNRGNSFMEKPFRKRTFSKPLRTAPGHSRRYGSESRKEDSGEKSPDQAFYSRYRKSGDGNRGSSSRKKTYYPKEKKH
jgi:hypothetical protein